MASKDRIGNRKTPKSLTEKIAAREMRDEVANLDQNPPVNKQVVFAAVAEFCYSWSDDSWDPLRSEVVAVYESRNRFELARKLLEIPKSLNAPLDSKYDIRLERLLLDTGGQKSPDGRIFVVFATAYEFLREYGGDYCYDHSNFLYDGSGVPLRAFVDRERAAEYEADQLKSFLNNIGETHRNLPDLPLEVLTSLSESALTSALKSLGLILPVEFSISYPLGPSIRTVFGLAYGRKQAITPDEKQLDLAKRVLNLFDRFRLFKTVAISYFE